MPSIGIDEPAASRARGQLWVTAAILATTALLVLGPDPTVGTSALLVPACLVLVLAFDLMTTGALVAGFRATGDERTLMLTWAFLWSAAITVGTLLSLPGVISPVVLTPEAVQRVTAFYVARHIGLPLLIIVALVPWPRRSEPGEPVERRLLVVVASHALVICLAAILVFLVFTYPTRLPDLTRTVDGIMSARPAVLLAVLIANLVLLGIAVVSALHRRLHRRLESWVVIALVADGADTMLTTMADGRWSVAWYGGRVMSVVGAGVVVIALLNESRRMQERTTLYAERLAAQNESLTEAQGLRDHLIAVVSHEMRSPLAGLQGYLEVLEADPDLTQADIARMHTRSRLLTRRLIMLTEDLLASATIHGPQVLTEPTALSHQIDDCVAAFPELSVIVRCPADVTVVADPLRLQQILTNLVRNAQKHGAEPVRIQAAVEGTTARISVSDAGAGVDPAFVSELFERYTRGPGRNTHGSGLGLSVARNLAERQCGRLDYEIASQTFVLELPTVERRATPRPRQTRGPTPPAEPARLASSS